MREKLTTGSYGWRIWSGNGNRLCLEMTIDHNWSSVDKSRDDTGLSFAEVEFLKFLFREKYGEKRFAYRGIVAQARNVMILKTRLLKKLREEL